MQENDPQLSGWWAQGVTVGYERIVGLRLPGQMPDGTFTVSRSRLLELDADKLRGRLLDDERRAQLLAGFTTVLRSKPASKSLRFSLADAAGEPLGVLMFTIDPAAGDLIRLTVTHEKLPDVGSTDAWKARWGEWLAAL